jgi:hypothetical protein
VGTGAGCGWGELVAHNRETKLKFFMMEGLLSDSLLFLLLLPQHLSGAKPRSARLLCQPASTFFICAKEIFQPVFFLWGGNKQAS